MSDQHTLNSSENDNLCVVCFKDAELYSVGVCDHPVCYECSTRMRVLCRQNECPICRQDMPKVIFTKSVEPFGGLFPRFERSNLQERKHGLIFCTADIKRAYELLLEHRCQVCKDREGDRSWPYKNFLQLKDHLRRDHELFFCDICVENLKIFSSERTCYTRSELALHRRKGDPDNTSHRGHPLCEFCDTRYMDSDELFRHLRRNHLYCHFCDADGKHQYYNNMDDLLRHFREEHYKCEEGECKTMPLTSVFRTDIDLKAHIATEHSRYMSKSATKQARTLELEFTLAPRMKNDNLRNKRYTDRRDRLDDDSAFTTHNLEPGGPGGGGEGGESHSGMFVNPLTPQDFPALGGSEAAVQRPIATVNFTSKMNSNFREDDFPTLGGSRYTPAPELTITGTMRGQQGLSKTTALSNSNFPALRGPSAGSSSGSTVRLSVNSSPDPNAANVSIHVNRRLNGGITTHITTSASSSSNQQKTAAAEAFPALGNAANVAQPQWVKVKNKKQEPKASKVAPTPQLPPSGLEQFPTLSKKTAANNWVNLNNINSARNSINNNNGDKKSEVKAPSSRSKQSVVENKLQELKVGDADSKYKSKKKKGKSNVEVEMNKPNVTSERLKSKPEAEPEANGLIKKRSELKIGTLTSSSLSSDDFPTLGSSKTKPPPGFNVAPPPGFTPTPLRSNDLTFTTSTGQSYSITPSSSYQQPGNFQTRNQNLIKKLMSVLNNNDSIKEFKTYSDLFRSGSYPTANYYDHCKTVLAQSFDETFPELLVLLPDIQKQQELYGFYDGKGKRNLVLCEHCKQVVFRKELSEHYNYHVLENQFPTLGKVHEVDNVWKK